jgi:lipid-A-disaccharide synthase
VSTKRIFISFGEKSAENHALPIIKALGSDYVFESLSGSTIKDLGVKTLHTLEETSVLGFTEVVKNYPRLRRMLKECCNHIKATRPNLLILIDYPGFNLPLAAYAKKNGIKTLYYIAPKTWAWGEWRVKKMAKTIDKMAVIFPFEERYFRSFGLDAEYVGNPNAEITPALDMKSEDQTLGILPGSRNQEVARILPPCVEAAKALLSKGRFTKVLVSKSENIVPEAISKYLPDDRFSVVNGTREVFSRSGFMFVKSGTSTLEAALAGKPFISVYKVSFLSGIIIKKMVKIPQVTMINIMLDKAVVPELMQEDVVPANIIFETEKLLDDKQKISDMLNSFNTLKQEIKNQHTSEKVSNMIRNMING